MINHVVACMEKVRMEMEKLKPCPFCGGKAEMLINEYRDSRKEYLAACTECDGMVERWRETEKEAVEQWNRRVNDKEDAKWIISTVDVDAVEL